MMTKGLPLASPIQVAQPFQAPGSVDGDTITFTPDAPLTSGGAYTATVDYCAGPATFDFTVSSLGAPLSADITGKTYAVDLASGNFVEPAGLATSSVVFLKTTS